MTDDESLEPRRKLTCFYMGRSATYTLTEAQLRDQWRDRVEMGEELGKGDGLEFEDADGPKEFEECPLHWKDGKATEMGCGSWRSGADQDALDHCAPLLLRAGLPKLTLVMKSAAPDFEATFDVDGVNADQLDALDRAEWRLRPLSADEQRALDAEEPFDLDDVLAP